LTKRGEKATYGRCQNLDSIMRFSAFSPIFLTTPDEKQGFEPIIKVLVVCRNSFFLFLTQRYKIMSKYQFFMGIDMSKLTFDFTLLDDSGKILLQNKIDNKPAAITQWMKQLQEHLNWSETLITTEHAGFYNTDLLSLLHKHTAANLWVESALRIKRSLGLQRGKTDKADATRIALYSLDYQRKASIWAPPSKSIEELGLLISHRDRFVKNLMSIRTPLQEQQDFIDSDYQAKLTQIAQPAIAAIKQAIKDLEVQIKTLIEKDSHTKRQRKIIESIPGFGPVSSAKLIEVTKGFSRLTNPRSLACYSGIAPFEYSSGTSVRGKTRVSHIANKDLKKLFHLAALVTIRKNGIMYEYYQRKLSEGKPTMAVINAIRNKLIHILLACIKKDTIYQENYQVNLVNT